MRTYIPAEKRIDVTVGESLRIMRELQGFARRNCPHRAASRKPPSPASKPGVSILASSAQRFWAPRSNATPP